jgi:hypothetical protein
MYHHTNAQPNKALVFMTLCVCVCLCLCLCVCLCTYIYHHINSQPGEDLVSVTLFNELELLVYLALVNAQANKALAFVTLWRNAQGFTDLAGRTGSYQGKGLSYFTLLQFFPTTLH